MVNSTEAGWCLWPCRRGRSWTPSSGSGRRSAPGFSPWKRNKSCRRHLQSCWSSPSAAPSPQNLPLYTSETHGTNNSLTNRVSLETICEARLKKRFGLANTSPAFAQFPLHLPRSHRVGASSVLSVGKGKFRRTSGELRNSYWVAVNISPSLFNKKGKNSVKMMEVFFVGWRQAHSAMMLAFI